MTFNVGKQECAPAQEKPENIWENEDFMEILPALIKKKEEKGTKPRVILATYNRVGEGKLNGRINQPNLVLDIINGAQNTPLSPDQIKKFFAETFSNLENQLTGSENGPIIIVYGGSGGNFNQAAFAIDNLNSLNEILEEKQKPQIFLLTCRCQIEGKIKAVLPLIQNKRLNGLIYSKENDCGGFKDLQEIADSLLGKKEKQLVN